MVWIKFIFLQKIGNQSNSQICFIWQGIYLNLESKMIVKNLKHCIFVTASPTRPAPAESPRVGTQQG